MRIRSLKPGFFKNEQLAELSPWHRLCYEGLWCYADREGRMEDRPKRLKAEIFPYDDLNMDALLWDLNHAGFIRRYALAGRAVIDIPTWDDHQHPRTDEAPSDLPAYEPGSERRDGPDVSTFPALTNLDTDPHLPSLGRETPARMGSGVLDLGSGVLGSGVAAAPLPHTAREIRASDLMELWNATTTPPIPRCRELTDGRRRQVRARLAKRPSFAEWRQVFEAIERNPFCRGENDRNWTADFDWIIKNDTNAAKQLERVNTPKSSPKKRWSSIDDCAHTPKCGSATICETQRIILAGRAERAKASV